MRQLTSAILFFTILVVIFFTLFGNHGLLHLLDINNEVAQITKKNRQLEEDLVTTDEKITEVRRSNVGLEKRARELGLSRPDEIIYKFRKPSSEK